MIYSCMEFVTPAGDFIAETSIQADCCSPVNSAVLPSRAAVGREAAQRAATAGLRAWCFAPRGWLRHAANGQHEGAPTLVTCANDPYNGRTLRLTVVVPAGARSGFRTS